jgi:hypothetical protein
MKDETNNSLLRDAKFSLGGTWLVGFSIYFQPSDEEP